MMPPMMGGARWFLYRVSAFFLRPYGGISTGPRAPRISSLGRDASGGTKNNSAALRWSLGVLSLCQICRRCSFLQTKNRALAKTRRAREIDRAPAKNAEKASDQKSLPNSALSFGMKETAADAADWRNRTAVIARTWRACLPISVGPRFSRSRTLVHHFADDALITSVKT